MEVVATTRTGRVRGTMSDGVASFRGIPYAAAPVGDNLLRPPRPPEEWDGVRDATAFGPTAPRAPYPQPMADLLAERFIDGSRYLNLNVWTPEPRGAGLPVMVWIHGGAFTNGSGAEPAYDAAEFARAGVVAVTLNYRLGAEGFGLFDGGTPNLGLLDQIAALEWVRDNIESFGGSPTKVTVFGESAGGMSVVTLMSLPRARGLFRRAIAQSGAGHTVLCPEDAATVARVLAERLGVPPTVAGMAGVPRDRLLAEQAAVSAEIRGGDADPEVWGERLSAPGTLPFAPVVDGELLTRRPIDGLRAGEGADVDLLIGSNREEFRLYLVPSGIIDHVGDRHLAAAVDRAGLDAKAATVYSAADQVASPGDALAALYTDLVFRIPAYRVLEARSRVGARVFGYEFAWRSPRFDGRLGACHAVELPFVFGVYANGHSLAGPDAPRELGEEMRAAWIRFAGTGEPGWGAWNPERRPLMRFDAPESGVVEDPDAETRRLWDGVLD